MPGIQYNGGGRQIALWWICIKRKYTSVGLDLNRSILDLSQAMLLSQTPWSQRNRLGTGAYFPKIPTNYFFGVTNRKRLIKRVVIMG